MRRLFAILVAAFLGGPALAAEPQTVLSLRETAEAMVVPDLLVVSLRAEGAADGAAAAQQAVNRQMKDSVAAAKAVSGVKVATGGYSAYVVRPGEGRPAREKPEWRASQGLTLTSREISPLLDLTGTLQASGLALSGMNFEVGAETRRDTQEKLVGEAIARLRRQADSAAAALDLRVVSYRTIRIEKAGGNSPRPMLRAMAAPMAAAVPPSAEAGEQEIQVTVEAEVGLDRR
ncbi:hypothetical protein CU669_04215 [Paramagnetospirillum kuznetsovii]|uniref:SIMPL domain-containing protein n=1 Tax=Paramagnetospirillum kuznetsovii TaxID=2053833 RepID=A0A364P1Y7_9PROT|nr:SIMPL domain-containing protein [Paramagnetospirillum kuznetsovii]RAU23344.1 hypothetical protein CU669_04215 [Paramagnetospirillum kuznetsovii]